MKRALLIPFILVLIPLYRCSWAEYFIVVNTTGTDATVTYLLNTELKGFPIFYDKPSCYEITRSGRINWDVKADITDTDSSPGVISVVLPSKCVLIFGGLTNDKYQSYNQEFINDRKFNLSKLRIECGNYVREITPAVFDNHFIKEKGKIKLEIK